MEGEEDHKVRSEDEENEEERKTRSGEEKALKEGDEGEGEGEEEGECPFCLFMKAGPCGKEFQEWERCIEKAEQESMDDAVVQCRSVTQTLMKCMEGAVDYYGPVLEAGEKLAQEGGEEDNVAQGREAEKSEKKEERREGQDGLQVNAEVNERKELPA